MNDLLSENALVLFKDIVEEMEAEARLQFGENTDTSNSTVLGKLIEIFARQTANVWAGVTDAYNATSIYTARGTQLDAIVANRDLVRYQNIKASTYISIVGEPFTVISAGFTVKNPATNRAYIVNLGGASYTTIPASGTISLQFIAEEAGEEYNTDSGTITAIATPVTGVTSVTNTAVVVNGVSYESDVQLRSRYLAYSRGTGTAEMMKQYLLTNVPNLQDVVITENVTMETDAYGNLPKSIHVYTLGGEDAQIAAAIYESKPAGIDTNGAITNNIIDSWGFTHVIHHDQVEIVTAYLRLQVTTDLQYSDDSNTKIKDDIIYFVGGSGTFGFAGGLGIGEPMYLSDIISIVKKVAGVVNVTVSSSTDGVAYEVADILPTMMQKVQTGTDFIEILR